LEAAVRNRLILTSGIVIGVFDEIFKLYEGTDADRQLEFELSNISDANTRTWTVADANGTVVLRNTTMPSNPTDTGTVGQMAWDDQYIAWVISTDRWVRAEGFSWAVSEDTMIYENGDTMLYENGDEMLFE
jgi:hypothetical protein